MDHLLQRALEIANRPRRCERVENAMNEETITEPAARPMVQAGDHVEWLSPALPRQQGEVLAVHGDGTFEVFHSLTEAVCRLPIAWITRVVNVPMNPEGPTP